MKLGCYPEIKLAKAREQVIKFRRVVFEGNDLRHLSSDVSEHFLLGYEYIYLRKY